MTIYEVMLDDYTDSVGLFASREAALKVVAWYRARYDADYGDVYAKIVQRTLIEGPDLPEGYDND